MSFKIGLRITIEFVFDILKFFLCTVREYYFWWLDMSRLYCGPQWSYCFNIFEPPCLSLFVDSCSCYSFRSFDIHTRHAFQSLLLLPIIISSLFMSFFVIQLFTLYNPETRAHDVQIKCIWDAVLLYIFLEKITRFSHIRMSSTKKCVITYRNFFHFFYLCKHTNILQTKKENFMEKFTIN